MCCTVCARARSSCAVLLTVQYAAGPGSLELLVCVLAQDCLYVFDLVTVNAKYLGCGCCYWCRSLALPPLLTTWSTCQALTSSGSTPQGAQHQHQRLAASYVCYHSSCVPSGPSIGMCLAFSWQFIATRNSPCAWQGGNLQRQLLSERAAVCATAAPGRHQACGQQRLPVAGRQHTVAAATGKLLAGNVCAFQCVMCCCCAAGLSPSRQSSHMTCHSWFSTHATTVRRCGSGGSQPQQQQQQQQQQQLGVLCEGPAGATSCSCCMLISAFIDLPAAASSRQLSLALMPPHWAAPVHASTSSNAKVITSNGSGHQVPAACVHGSTQWLTRACVCMPAAAVRDYRRHNKYAARKVDRSPLDFSQVGFRSPLEGRVLVDPRGQAGRGRGGHCNQQQLCTAAVRECRHRCWALCWCEAALFLRGSKRSLLVGMFAGAAQTGCGSVSGLQPGVYSACCCEAPNPHSNRHACLATCGSVLPCQLMLAASSSLPAN
jgi:hypothetical protein